MRPADGLAEAAMPVLETRIASEHPDRLLLKLCKHFRHKVPADFDAAAGRVDFQPGLCLMRACSDALELRVEGEGAERARAILDAHLPRFLGNPAFSADWHTQAV